MRLYKNCAYNWAIYDVCSEIVVSKFYLMSLLISLLIWVFEIWWGFNCCLLALLRYLKLNRLDCVSTGWIRWCDFNVEIESKYRTTNDLKDPLALIKLN